MPDQITKFKKALEDKDISLADLLSLDYDKLVEKLTPYAGENAGDVAKTIQDKLILKNKGLGITNAIDKLIQTGKYSPEEQARLKGLASDWKGKQMRRTFNPSESEGYLAKRVEKILGAPVPREAIKKVFDLTGEMNKLKDKNAGFSGVSDEFLKKRSELNSYVDSFKTVTPLKAIAKNIAVWGRNSLLANLATPLKAIENQGFNSAIDYLTRRLSDLSISGLNPELVKQANAEAWKTFQDTGHNVASMENMDDAHKLGKGEQFQVPAEPSYRPINYLEKFTRKAAAISNLVIIDWAHNTPFTKFYQKAFYDMADFASTDVAKMESKSKGFSDEQTKARAAEIFKDATRIEPETREGAAVRQAAQKQGAWVTSTNDSRITETALKLKNALNNLIPDVPLGDFLQPIIKIPVNIVVNGIETSGAGIPMGIYDIFKGREKIDSIDVKDKIDGLMQYRQGVQKLVRTFGSIAVGYLLASQWNKDDFKTDKYGTHYFRLGDTWINTEYTAAISLAFAGFMAMKEGTGAAEKVANYLSGSLTAVKNLPISAGTDLLNAVTGKSFGKYIGDFFTSRGEPAIIKNILSNRPIERLFFGAHGVESSAEVLQDLPSKEDWGTSTSNVIKQLKQKIGPDKLQQANDKYNTQYNNWLDEVSNSKTFQTLSDADKKRIEANKKTEIKNNIFKQYGFTYKATPKTALPKL